MLKSDLDGSENESDGLSITVTAHILMGAVISLPWDVLQVPMAVSHLDLQSLLGPVCYLFHAGVVLVLMGKIISATQIS